MKRINNLLLGVVALILISCATTVKFPVSNKVPAAKITAKVKHDKNKNYLIEITALNLASPDRLNPPENSYVVWLVTENNGTKNIGQMINKNAEKAILKATSPFEPKEIFITAENQGNISNPSGLEIARAQVANK
jgi:hypothetical protein